MASLQKLGEETALWSDTTTGDKGIVVRRSNYTGETTVKGQLVAAPTYSSGRTIVDSGNALASHTNGAGIIMTGATTANTDTGSLDNLRKLYFVWDATSTTSVTVTFYKDSGLTQSVATGTFGNTTNTVYTCSQTNSSGLTIYLQKNSNPSSFTDDLTGNSIEFIYKPSVIKQSGEYDAHGVVMETGIANGSDVWVMVTGDCEVLMDGYSETIGSTDGTLTNNRPTLPGQILLSSATDGYGTSINIPASNPTSTQHFKECGHVLRGSYGLNSLALCTIHFL